MRLVTGDINDAFREVMRGPGPGTARARARSLVTRGHEVGAGRRAARPVRHKQGPRCYGRRLGRRPGLRPARAGPRRPAWCAQAHRLTGDAGRRPRVGRPDRGHGGCHPGGRGGAARPAHPPSARPGPGRHAHTAATPTATRCARPSRNAADRPDSAASLLAAAAGRSLVAVVRDAHRDQATRSLITALLAARPDTVLVEMGLPLWRPPQDSSYLATYGASRASAQAAAELLGLV